MVHMLYKELKQQGYTVKKYIESDYTNPIDFYSAAYLPVNEYNKLLKNYRLYTDTIYSNTTVVGDIRLVRYYNKNVPLFDEPLLSELLQKEFCYKPSQLVPLKEYTAVYTRLWHNFALEIDETYDYIIFDGSLLHHPINDMMRNYKMDGEEAALHITSLLKALGKRSRQIIYLKTDNIYEQLKRAYLFRKQNSPTDDNIQFCQTRYKNDMTVLSCIDENYKIYNISNNGWQFARNQILMDLQKG